SNIGTKENAVMRDLDSSARKLALSAVSFMFCAAAALPAIALFASPGSESGSSAIVGTQASKRTKARAGKAMRAFGSEGELGAYFRQLYEKGKRALGAAGNQPTGALAGVAAEYAAAPPEAPKQESESITNTQHAGVDEGGIVKLHGDHLVILRRGRLFTVAIGDGALKPVSAVDAFGPEIDPRHTWYDELLVSEDTVVVIGYSYERGGTEVGLFRIDSGGNLTYRATYHFRSDDYYAS